MKNIEVVAGIIQKDGRFFATERGYGEFQGFWEFPGGKIEKSETREDALHRELQEELSIKVNIEKFICTTDYDYPNFHLTMHCFLCSIRSGEIRLLEHQDAKWLKTNELKSIKWLPADLEVIDLIEKLNSEDD